MSETIPKSEHKLFVNNHNQNEFEQQVNEYLRKYPGAKVLGSGGDKFYGWLACVFSYHDPKLAKEHYETVKKDVIYQIKVIVGRQKKFEEELTKFVDEHPNMKAEDFRYMGYDSSGNIYAYIVYEAFKTIEQK